MSVDLISRKALVSNLKLFLDRSFLGETRAHDCISVGEIAGLIKDEPTAYDVDKDIERLKELKTYKLNMADAMSEIMRRDELGTYVCLEDVLEIVKSGGATND